MRFRVWCLSWDDTEVDGREVVGYDPVTTDGVHGYVIMVPFYNLASPSEAAEAYADWCHRHRDAYECTWPLTFRVRSGDGTEQDFEVDREMEPVFTARGVR